MTRENRTHGFPSYEGPDPARFPGEWGTVVGTVSAPVGGSVTFQFLPLGEHWIDDLQIGFRDALPDDAEFMLSSWLRSHRDMGDWPGRVSKGRYFDEHKLVVMGLLAKSKVLVACEVLRPDRIAGFIVWEPADQGACRPHVLHWLHVRHEWRRAKLARGLLERARLLTDTAPDAWHVGLACSHWTRHAQTMRERGYPLVYNPFLLETRS